MRAYRELTGHERVVWDRFDAVFDFRPSMHRFPAITEPTQSVTWSLNGLDDDPGYVRLDRLVQIVHVGFTALAGEGSILCLDWQHPCYRVWPSLVGPENIDPPGQPGWPLRRIQPGGGAFGRPEPDRRRSDRHHLRQRRDCARRDPRSPAPRARHAE